IVAGLCGLVLNRLPAELLADLWIGRVVTLPIAMLLGPWYGSLAALLGAAAAMPAYPVRAAAFVIEAVLVAYLVRRRAGVLTITGVLAAFWTLVVSALGPTGAPYVTVLIVQRALDMMVSVVAADVIYFLIESARSARDPSRRGQLGLRSHTLHV